MANFIVSIGTDGKIRSQVTLAANLDPKLAKELELDEAVTALGDEVIDNVEETPSKRAGEGKLTVAEEIVEGRVTWHSFKLLLFGLGRRTIPFCSAWSSSSPLIYWIIQATTSRHGTLDTGDRNTKSHPASEVPVYL